MAKTLPRNICRKELPALGWQLSGILATVFRKICTLVVAAGLMGALNPFVDIRYKRLWQSV
jgi:hypothetical protein